MEALRSPRIGMAIAGAVVGLSLIASVTRGSAQIAALVFLGAAFAAMVIADFADRGMRAILGAVGLGIAIALTGITRSLIPLAAIAGVGFLDSLRRSKRA